MPTNYLFDMIENDNYVFCCSGGRSSGLLTIEGLLNPKYENALISFQNTGKEDPRTLDYVNDIDKYLGGDRIVWLEYENNEAGYKIVTYETASRNGEPFAKLIFKHNSLPNRVARFCTQELKIRPLKKYCQQALGWKTWTNLVGIRYDEPRRWAKGQAAAAKECYDVEHPLVRMKITKPIVLDYWRAMSFDLGLSSKPIGILSDFPEEYGNCDVCFLKGKKKKMRIAKFDPELFIWWIGQEKLKKGKGSGGRFCNDYTYEQILNLVQTQPELFDIMYEDDDIACFCNVD